MQIQTIFTNFIATEKLSLDNESIKNYCYNVLSNKEIGKSYHFNFSEPELQILYKTVYDKFNELHKHFGFSVNYEQKIYNAWANINHEPYITAPHVHAQDQGFMFSAVYYPKAEEDCAPLELTTPNAAHKYVIYRKMVEKFNEFNSSSWKHKPQSGELIIFPCWLLHHVVGSKQNNDRISIAFNSKIVLK